MNTQNLIIAQVQSEIQERNSLEVCAIVMYLNLVVLPLAVFSFIFVQQTWQAQHMLLCLPKPKLKFNYVLRAVLALLE